MRKFLGWSGIILTVLIAGIISLPLSYYIYFNIYPAPPQFKNLKVEIEKDDESKTDNKLFRRKFRKSIKTLEAYLDSSEKDEKRGILNKLDKLSNEMSKLRPEAFETITIKGQFYLKKTEFYYELGKKEKAKRIYKKGLNYINKLEKKLSDEGVTSVSEDLSQSAIEDYKIFKDIYMESEKK